MSAFEPFAVYNGVRILLGTLGFRICTNPAGWPVSPASDLEWVGRAEFSLPENPSNVQLSDFGMKTCYLHVTATASEMNPDGDGDLTFTLGDEMADVLLDAIEPIDFPVKVFKAMPQACLQDVCEELLERWEELTATDVDPVGNPDPSGEGADSDPQCEEGGGIDDGDLDRILTKAFRERPGAPKAPRPAALLAPPKVMKLTKVPAEEPTVIRVTPPSPEVQRVGGPQKARMVNTYRRIPDEHVPSTIHELNNLYISDSLAALAFSMGYSISKPEWTYPLPPHFPDAGWMARRELIVADPVFRGTQLERWFLYLVPELLAPDINVSADWTAKPPPKYKRRCAGHVRLFIQSSEGRMVKAGTAGGMSDWVELDVTVPLNTDAIKDFDKVLRELWINVQSTKLTKRFTESRLYMPPRVLDEHCAT